MYLVHVGHPRLSAAYVADLCNWVVAHCGLSSIPGAHPPQRSMGCPLTCQEGSG